MTKQPFIVIYSIILIMFCIKYFLSFPSKESDSLVEWIDQFIIVKEYIKNCVYGISNTILREAKKQAISRKSVKEIDEEINILSKNVCKALSHFIRKDEIFESLRNNNNTEYFIFPDTMLIKSHLTYYSKILCICSDITGCNIDIDKSEANCKLYISSIL